MDQPLPSLSSPTPPSRPVTHAPFNSAHFDRFCMGGLALALASGVVCMSGAWSDSQLAVQGELFAVARDSVFIGVGAVAVVLFGLALALPYAWARLSGIGLMPVFGLIYAAILFGAKASAFFNTFDPIAIGSGGRFLVFAFVVLLVGFVLALVGSPRIGRAVPPDLATPVGISGYAVTGLVLSLCGLVTFGLSAPLGIAFSVAGFDDVKRSEGARSGRGMAVAGLVVGIVFTAFAVLMVVGVMGVTDPRTINDITDESATILRGL